MRSVHSMTAVQSVMSWFLGLMLSESKAVSSLGTMFLVRKANMEALLNTSDQGNKINLADLSAGCHAASAAANLFLMVG